MEQDSENVEIAKKGYEAFRQKGVEGLIEFLDPKIEWRAWSQYSREGNVVTGHDAVREVVSVYAENFADLGAVPLEFIEAPDGRIVVPFRLVGREKGSGREVEMDFVHVWTPGDDGRATRLEVYESRGEALRAVGLNETD